jgi:hypothetical protein
LSLFVAAGQNPRTPRTVFQTVFQNHERFVDFDKQSNAGCSGRQLGEDEAGDA